MPPLLFVEESEWGETIYPNGKRHYTTPSGTILPSVTTFLDAILDKSFLAAWRKKMGEEEADRIVARACDRGERVHKCMELYVTNSPEWDVTMCGQFEFMFHQIRRVVDRKLDSVIYSEHALWSDTLGLAGRVDLCGMWDGQLAIIDFKNKNRLSKREDIMGYFVQCTVYAIMHHAMYGVLPEKIVVLLAIEDHVHKECQVMVENTRDWVPKVMELLREYRAKKANA